MNKDTCFFPNVEGATAMKGQGPTPSPSIWREAGVLVRVGPVDLLPQLCSLENWLR